MNIQHYTKQFTDVLTELYYIEEYEAEFDEIVSYIKTEVATPILVVSDNDENDHEDTHAFMEWMEHHHEDMILYTTEWVKNPNSGNNIRAMLIKTGKWKEVDALLNSAIISARQSWSCCGMAIGDAHDFAGMCRIEDEWESAFYAITIKFGNLAELAHCDWIHMSPNGSGIGVYTAYK